jgi:hypothetical protein
MKLLRFNLKACYCGDDFLSHVWRHPTKSGITIHGRCRKCNCPKWQPFTKGTA